MKYNVAVTLPLTLWVEVEAENEEDALIKARDEALYTPYEEWGDDFSSVQCEIVNN